MNHKIYGLVAAVHTPMHEDGQINFDVIEKQAELLIEQNVSGAFVCGSTGEASSLTIGERKAILQRWCDVSNHQLSIIAHVGQTNVNDVWELARHASGLNVDAISTTGPVVHQPQTTDELIRYCNIVAKAAHDKPLYYYHSPNVISSNVSLIDFLIQAKNKIPNLAGVKFNDQDFCLYQRCASLFNGYFDIPFATDELLLSALSYGASGAVGSLYNYVAEIFHRLHSAYKLNDMHNARLISLRILDIVDILKRFGVLASGKKMMLLHDIDCGPPRMPVSPVPENVIESLLEDITSIIEDTCSLPVTDDATFLCNTYGKEK
ncbi:dihydrodipicolinate synthase family protein [Poriferisphaera sp. WC338]|uniref:dihydrodipicolinate synthase family protein n=1 Tax=Poriferisphaera sp. WC338 TaxID=3425129 RepID=UPI003D817EEE